ARRPPGKPGRTQRGAAQSRHSSERPSCPRAARCAEHRQRQTGQEVSAAARKDGATADQGAREAPAEARKGRPTGGAAESKPSAPATDRTATPAADAKTLSKTDTAATAHAATAAAASRSCTKGCAEACSG